MNINELIGLNRYLTTFNRGIIASELVDQLISFGPFTVFAPSELAFGKLAGGVFSKLEKPENKLLMKNVINSYIAGRKMMFCDFVDGQKIQTLGGMELLVAVENKVVTVNGAKIQAKDMEASNGVVHSLDRLIFNINIK